MGVSTAKQVLGIGETMRRLSASAVLILLAALLLTFGWAARFVRAQTGTIWVVNTTQDLETGCPEDCSLRSAVAQAADGDTIGFALNPVSTLILERPIPLDRDLTIEGVDQTTSGQLLGVRTLISGGGTTKLFVIADSATVELNDLILRDGFAEESGGLIENHGVLTLTNMTLQASAAQERGGAVFSNGSLTVRDSTFLNNSAARGGAIDSNRTAISGSTFAYNTAEEFGGALEGDGGGFTISNSTFVGNSAQSGGAIHLSGFLSLASIANSTLARNRAEYGGAICNTEDDNVFLLFSSLFAGNDATGSPDPCTYATSRGYNVVGDATSARWTERDLLGAGVELGDLSAVGGLPPTLTLESGTPVVGAGNCAGDAGAHIPAVTVDQRGAARKTSCDAGAVESEAR